MCRYGYRCWWNCMLPKREETLYGYWSEEFTLSGIEIRIYLDRQSFPTYSPLPQARINAEQLWRRWILSHKEWETSFQEDLGNYPVFFSFILLQYFELNFLCLFFQRRCHLKKRFNNFFKEESHEIPKNLKKNTMIATVGWKNTTLPASNIQL